MRIERVTIKGLGINGEGICYIRKKICFVNQGLVGDEVDIQIDKEERRYMLGHIVKFYKKSSQRIPSPCRESRNCQGCAFMHMRYNDQLNYKREMIKESLMKYTDIDLDTIDLKPVIESSEPTGYRYEIGFPIGYYKGKLAIGVYQRGNRYFTFMNHCFLQTDIINNTLVAIEDILNKYNCHDYNDRMQRGLRFIMVKQVEDSLSIVFITGTDGIKQLVTDEIEKLPYVSSVYYSINTAKYQEFEEKGYKRIYGDHLQTYHFKEHEYSLSIKSDILENPVMDLKLLEVLKRLIKKEDLLLSLYAGNGIIESELDNDTIALEVESWHVEDANRNALQNGMMNKMFAKGDVVEEFTYQSKKNDFDTLLIHLNKEVLDEDLQESIIKSLIPSIIFISDNVASAAKTITALSKRYKLDEYVALDSEPYTARVRSVVKLVRK